MTDPTGPLGDDIIVWGKPSCPQCTATIRRLDERGVVYRYADLSDPQHLEHLERFRAAGLQRAPVVETADRRWAGFRPDLIDEVCRDRLGE